MTLTVHNATPVALYGGGGRVCTTNGGCRSDEPCRGEAVCGAAELGGRGESTAAAELGGRGESTGAARRVGWLGGVGGASSERSTSTLNIKNRRHVERFVESSMLGYKYSFGRFRFSFRISYLPFRAMSLAAWRA
jgi:hypothetical protein